MALGTAVVGLGVVSETYLDGIDANPRTRLAAVSNLDTDRVRATASEYGVPGYDETSEWLWYAKKGERNELHEWGENWDYARYSDNNGDGYAESWYIGPNAGKNYIWRKQGSATGGIGSTVLDESNGESNSKYLLLDRLGIPVEDLEKWDDAA